MRYTPIVLVLLTSVAFADNGPTTVPSFPWKPSAEKAPANRIPHLEVKAAGKWFEVDWGPGSSGGTVTAKGREVWKSRLKALGPVAHSAYHNTIAVDANDNYVIIFGNESYGRYIEVKDVGSGNTLKVTQLWKSLDLVSRQYRPLPTVFPDYAWQWDEKLIDQPLTTGNSRYSVKKESADTPRPTAVASDVESGQQRWKYEIRGFTGRFGSPPRDFHFNLRFVDGKLLVYGIKPRGWFIEVFDPELGISTTVIQYWRPPAIPDPAVEKAKSPMHEGGKDG